MFEIKIVIDGVTLHELKSMAENQFGSLVKAVVDVERKMMAIGGELHSDEETIMIENGSLQKDLWGINIYPEQPGADRIEFDSMINIRPYLGNKSRSVENHDTQIRILEITNQLIKD